MNPIFLNENQFALMEQIKKHIAYVDNELSHYNVVDSNSNIILQLRSHGSSEHLDCHREKHLSNQEQETFINELNLVCIFV